MAGSNKLLKSEYIRLQKKAVRIPVGEAVCRQHKETPQKGRTQPEVDFVKAQDGTVQSITVRCTCGRDITLQCEYLEDGGENGQESS